MPRKKVPEAVKIQSWTDMINEAKKFAPKYKKINYPKKKGEKHLAIFSIPDLHLGKLCWGKESGDDYDIGIAKQTLRDAVDSMIAGCKHLDLEEIVYPVGNDFLQMDNSRNTTTAGTPVDTDGRWPKAITEGRKVLVETIDKLSQVAPVRVVVVPGNHDMERSFCLGEMLYCWYKNCPNVYVDNFPQPRKFYEYGINMIMWTHGDKERHLNLPNIMATEAREMWGRTKYSEVHCGHFHTRRDTQHVSVNEFNGTRVRILPSLSPADSWHNQRGFWNVRSSTALIYHKTKGLVLEVNHNIIK